MENLPCYRILPVQATCHQLLVTLFRVTLIDSWMFLLHWVYVLLLNCPMIPVVTLSSLSFSSCPLCISFLLVLISPVYPEYALYSLSRVINISALLFLVFFANWNYSMITFYFTLISIYKWVYTKFLFQDLFPHSW